MDDQLFDIPDAPTPAECNTSQATVAIAVGAHVWDVYDYHWPESFAPPQVGQRVTVPFGRNRKPRPGVVVNTHSRSSLGGRIKPVAELLDPAPALDDHLLELGRWISRYYLCPLGMILCAMVPSAVGRHGDRREAIARLASEPSDWPRQLGAKQRRVLDELLEARRQGVEVLTVEQLLHHADAHRDTLKRLAGRKLIEMDSRPVALEAPTGEVHEDPFPLNDDQKMVLRELDPKLKGGFSATLLHGVTGSGKTEVYLRAIRQVNAAGKQAIMLVPEIALATQTLTRLLERLPGVVVMHSGLTDAQRAFSWSKIRDGEANIVVGPRSAIFAPCPNLGLIIVDEEHEPTYKQDTVPRYHGRDVAVKRASIEQVPIVLGSATPSLETIHNVREGRYDKLSLPRRVQGLDMPTLELVNLRKEVRHDHRIELIGQTLTRQMATALDRNEQIILLMNRRGYANYVFCPSCKWEMFCDACSRPMVYHQALRLMMCHYCNHTTELPELCPACGKKIVLFGYGIQRIENELSMKFPDAKVARMDSDTMTSPKQFRQVFEDFSSGDLDILLGTQMVAKGLDFPRVSLVGVISADTSLAIPDFRAAERTFQLIVQVAGRAGRGKAGGRVVVQTMHAEEPAVALAVDHNFDAFATHELKDREDAQLPPFARLVRFIVRHEHQEKAMDGAEQVARRLRAMLPADSGVLIYDAMPAGIPRIRNQIRYSVLLTQPKAGVIQHALAGRMAELSADIPAEIIADIDPINLV